VRVTTTRVKICGVSDPADASRVAELGAWALGMIFWPSSPRACSREDGEVIGAELHRRLELVGVFVNAPLDEVASTADLCRLSMLQLHGDEGPAYCREAARRTGAKVMKAARVRDAAQVHDLQRFHTDLHLLDAYSPRSPGGTGESFDWELARLHPPRPPVVLSGGLTPDNVGAAMAAARPFAVDVASGTEAEPGRKDPAKLTAFMRAVAAADERLGAVA
jgi:phosphoribosylanthranilate isomerase